MIATQWKSAEQEVWFCLQLRSFTFANWKKNKPDLQTTTSDFPFMKSLNDGCQLLEEKNVNRGKENNNLTWSPRLISF